MTVQLDVLTVVPVNVTPCSLVDIEQRFEMPKVEAAGIYQPDATSLRSESYLMRVAGCEVQTAVAVMP
jgi:hypothetical protein